MSEADPGASALASAVRNALADLGWPDVSIITEW